MRLDVDLGAIALVKYNWGALTAASVAQLSVLFVGQEVVMTPVSKGELGIPAID